MISLFHYTDWCSLVICYSSDCDIMFCIRCSLINGVYVRIVVSGSLRECFPLFFIFSGRGGLLGS